MAENKTLEHLPEVRAAVAALSPEDREVLAAVQASLFKLTAPEQFKEFAANIDYFVFEPNIHDLNDLGWRYLAQHISATVTGSTLLKNNALIASLLVIVVRLLRLLPICVMCFKKSVKYEIQLLWDTYG